MRSFLKYSLFLIEIQHTQLLRDVYLKYSGAMHQLPYPTPALFLNQPTDFSVLGIVAAQERNPLANFLTFVGVAVCHYFGNAGPGRAVNLPPSAPDFIPQPVPCIEHIQRTGWKPYAVFSSRCPNFRLVVTGRIYCIVLQVTEPVRKPLPVMCFP